MIDSIQSRLMHALVIYSVCLICTNICLYRCITGTHAPRQPAVPALKYSVLRTIIIIPCTYCRLAGTPPTKTVSPRNQQTTRHVSTNALVLIARANSLGAKSARSSISILPRHLEEDDLSSQQSWRMRIRPFLPSGITHS
jgi:hypothetical protein